MKLRVFDLSCIIREPVIPAPKNRAESMKTCNKCNRTLPLNTDYWHRRMSDTNGNGWKAHCKDCRINERKSHYNNNREKVLEQSKKYHARTLEYQQARRKRWASNNKDKRRATARKRRALIKGNDHQPYTEQEVLNKYGINCYLCGYEIDLNAPRNCRGNNWEAGLHIEHLIAISNGGPDSIDNVRPSHAICNLTKGVKDV